MSSFEQRNAHFDRLFATKNLFWLGQNTNHLPMHPLVRQAMIDSIEGDVKGVSVVQAKVVELADKIETSQKAIVTIRKIHRTMCLKDQRTVSQAEDRVSR